MEQHKKDLADLATVDPEFYKFLKKEDASLLAFDVDEDEMIPDDDPEQETHQLPEHLAEMEPQSDEVRRTTRWTWLPGHVLVLGGRE